MKVWYLSEQRFINRIIRRWERNGFRYNPGHINILRYAYRALLYWSNVKKEKVSKANEVETHPMLF